MQKLIICAPRWGQSTPKVRAICSICPPSCAAKKMKAIILALTRRKLLLQQEQNVKHNGFREGDRENRLDENLGGGPGIPSDGGCGRPTYQTHSDGRTQRGHADVETSAHLE